MKKSCLRAAPACLWAALCAAILLVSSCSPDGTPAITPGAPASTSISNAAGVFLVDSGTASHSISRTLSGRAVIDTSGADLGTVDALGAVESAGFVDADGLPVSVVITRAAQLSSQHVLISYTYADTGATAILYLDSGALTVVSYVPDNWTRIFSHGTTAWYSSAGSLYALDLDSGMAALKSDGAEVYQSAGSYQLDASDLGYTAPWGSSTWVYADLAGNVYAIDMQNSQSIRAQVVTAAGVQKDFGFQYEVQDFFALLPGSSVNAKYAHALYDDATGNCFIVRGREIWDNNPEAVGGAVATGGYVLHLYPVTFNPSASDVLQFAMTTPIAYSVMTGASWLSSTYIGAGFLMDTSVLSFGNRTYKTAATTIAAYDTSTVPVSHITPSGGTDDCFVENWVFSGGEVYAGPTGTSAAIALVDLSAATAAVHTLVTDASITSWSIVSGVLFYTNATGTYKASVDTATGTLGTVSPYDGGTVTAVTQ